MVWTLANGVLVDVAPGSSPAAAPSPFALPTAPSGGNPWAPPISAPPASGGAPPSPWGAPPSPTPSPWGAGAVPSAAPPPAPLPVAAPSPSSDGSGRGPFSGSSGYGPLGDGLQTALAPFFRPLPFDLSNMPALKIDLSGMPALRLPTPAPGSAVF